MRLRKHSRQFRFARGTTFIEALVSVSIAGILFTSLFAGLTSGLDQIEAIRQEVRATQILVEKFETIRLYSWDQVNTPDFMPATFEAPYVPEIQREESTTLESTSEGIVFYGKVTLSDPPSSVAFTNDMKLVTIELTWDTGSTIRTNTLSSFISRYGIQNYVY